MAKIMTSQQQNFGLKGILPRVDSDVLCIEY